jgi:hypothetical protein
MTERIKKIIKIGGIVAVGIGAVGIYIGGGSEGYTIEIVAGVFVGIGIITTLIKGI